MLVQKLRLQRGWSQEQLAELSGLSVRTIQRMERGLPASNETLKSLASVFEIDFSTLQATQEPVMNTTLNQTDVPTSALEQPSSNAHVTSDEAAALRHVRKIRGFYSNVTNYIVVGGGLVILNFLKWPNDLWIVWPAVGAGIGLLFKGLQIFGVIPFKNPDWEKRQVEKYLGRKL